MNYLIALVVALCSVIGSYFYGHHTGYKESQAEMIVKIAESNTKSREVENNLNEQISNLSTQLVKVQDDAKKEIAKRDSAIATGKLQLYVKTKPTVCPSKDAPSTSGPDTATAQLDPTFAQSIVTITDDGDSAIRKLNACIATYNQVREMLNGTTSIR
jgi:prophage endopeptidase